MKKEMQKLIALMILSLLPVFVAGCWNNIELNDRGFVMAAGLDKAKNNKIEISVQVLKPSAIESRKQGGSIKATDTISSQGDTVFEAIRNLLTKTDHKLYYGDIQVIVIGEALARQGIADVLDWFYRDNEPDKRTSIVIARGITARQIISAQGKTQDIPAVEIANTLQNTRNLPKITDSPLYEVIKNINSQGKNSIISIASASKPQSGLNITDLNFEGAAVFKKDKLVNWLTPENTTGYLFTQNKVKSSIIKIPNPVDKQGKVSVEIIRSKSKMDIHLRNGEPVLSVKVKAEGNIGDQEGKGDLTSYTQVKELENETSSNIKGRITASVQKAQEYQSDIFGFGDIVHKKNLKYWQTLENGWDSQFAQSPVDVKVEFKIKQSGLIKKQAGDAK